MILHYVNFKDVISIQNYLNAFPYWTFVTVNNSTHDPNDDNDPEIYKRVYKNASGYLEFLRTETEVNDTTDTGFKGTVPRIELVPRILLPKKTPIHINYWFSPIQGAGFKGLLFQLMDHALSGKALPIFQLEIRNNKLTARWSVIKDGEYVKTSVSSFTDMIWGGQKWYYVDIYAYLSDGLDGRLKVLLDGNVVWEQNKMVTATTHGNTVNIQYGIYGDQGIKVRTQVKQLLWETVSSF